MIGMTFGEFVIVLIAGLISAVVIHYVVDYRFLSGGDGFLCKWIAGWVGAWLGSPVLGHWAQSLKYDSIYFVPALIGAFVGSFVITASWKAAAKTYAPQTTAKSYDMPKAA
jgi:uncharacterized membrane protein YeaQ/YmgE (transglycosylase-associated protein family)